MNASCTWKQDEDYGDSWATKCCEMFVLNDGGPAENKMRFCPFCGKPIAVQRFHEMVQ